MKQKTRRVSFLLFLLLTSCCYKQRVQSTIERTYQNEGFSMILPYNVLIHEISPIEDFVLVSFSCDSLILQGYIGNNPDINFENYATIDTIYGKGYYLLDKQWMDNDTLWYRELIFDLSQRESFPEYLHFWYGPLARDAKNLADNLIRSVIIE